MVIGRNRKLKIIALDDDLIVREYIKKSLKDECELYLADSIKSFNEITKSINANIFLIDITLPDGNGIDLCIEIKSKLKYRDSFIIMLTGLVDDKTIELAYSSGADDYLRKPFNIYELSSKIKLLKKIIDAKENLRQSFQSQLDHNVQLFKLGNYIKKLFDQKDQDGIITSSEILLDLVDLDYIEILKVKKGLPLSIAQKNKLTDDEIIQFKDLRKKIQGNKSIGKNYVFMRAKKKGREIFICFITFKAQNIIFGYALLEKNSPFSQNEREIMFLYLDYINLLNRNVQIQCQLKKINTNYKNEIEIIRKFELSLFPHFSDINEFDMAFSFMPATELSGDFFDGYYIDEDIYQVVLCDVAGHGIASSYLGNQIRTLFKSHSRSGKSPAELANEVNEILAIDLAEFHHYCTAQIMQIFVDTGQVIFMSAGHPEAIMWNGKDKEFKKIGSENPVIGMFDGIVYKDEVINMSPNDFLFLYTDGITEETAPDSDEMFGTERLISGLNGRQDLTSLELVHSSLGDLYEYNGYRPQHDDITLLCIKRK